MKYAILAFLLTLLSCTFTFAERTDGHPDPNLAEDRTDKIIAQEGEFWDYSFTPMTPEALPIPENPSPFCIAPDGYDSYPNGAAAPKRIYPNEENGRIRYHVADYFFSKTLPVNKMWRRAKDEKWLPEWNYNANEESLLRVNIRSWADSHVGAVYDDKSVVFVSNDGIYFGNGEGWFPCQSIEIGSDVDGEKKRDTITKDYSEQELVRFVKEEWSQRMKYLVLRDKGINEFILIGRDFKVFKRCPFPKLKYGECWTYGNALWPYLLITDSNFGYVHDWWPELEFVKHHDTWERDFSKWPKRQPDLKEQRLLVYDLEQGEVVAAYDGLDYADIMPGGTIRIPRVVKNGQWGWSVVKDGSEVVFVPAAYLYRTEPTYPFMISYNASQASSGFAEGCLTAEEFAIFNYRDLRIDHYRFKAPLDTENFGISDDYFQSIVTKPYKCGDGMVRDAFVFTFNNFVRPPVLYTVRLPSSEFLLSEGQFTHYSAGGTLYLMVRGEYRKYLLKQTERMLAP